MNTFFIFCFVPKFKMIHAAEQHVCYKKGDSLKLRLRNI